MNALDRFHPLIRDWFAETIGPPTAVQDLAWPRIAAGEHVLMVAPTGSGKTLAAFLWGIHQLASGAWAGGAVRLLYVSPLKALNTDIRRNLLRPLDELRQRFAAAGASMPEIHVLTRSGDTPAEERQRMARRPPEILITTPESLNILLTSRRGRVMLSGPRAVILDEVHAVVSGKRGVHLITAVERLAHLAGEFQRLALSATVRPAARVAEWVGGWERLEAGGHRRRRVAIVEAPGQKAYDLHVVFPAAAMEDAEPSGPLTAGYWDLLVRELTKPLTTNRSTLIFANSRRMVEKLTRLINEKQTEQLAFSHHGSLAREIRAVVEERLKNGELKGIVATSSLELGIDIGALDEVILVQTPPSVASTVQRIGRAGHAVGAISRARFVPLVARDLIDAAVVADAALRGEIEPVRPVVAPLDVLAQVIVSMTATEAWPIDELEAVLRCAWPYQDLTRRQLDLVIEMLAGRYSEVRLSSLRPLITIDRVAGTVSGRAGAERLVYLAGGTIPDRGYFHLRRLDSGALLGELDEEFVWERALGDTFTLGVQNWRIERVTHNDVLVVPAHAHAAMAPFWRADERDRGFELAERVARFLERAEAGLDQPDFAARFELDRLVSGAAGQAMQTFLARQRAALKGVLPHRHRLVIEHVVPPQRMGEPSHVILHTLWGGRVNRPFALALKTAWEEQHGVPLEVCHDDDCVILSTTARIETGELVPLMTGADIDQLLRVSLESTGFFGARFRMAAACALLLPREGFRRRTPLWLSRQRAKDLLAAVRRFTDFPLLLEAWRTCLTDDMDLDALHRLLDELRTGEIEVREVRTEEPSPFASHGLWKRTNQLMYADDAADVAAASRLRPDLLKEVLHTTHLRPRLQPALVDVVRRKLQRTYPGYAPESAGELLDLLLERGILPIEEWDALLAVLRREAGDATAQWLAEISDRAVVVQLPGIEGPTLVAAVQALPRGLRALQLRPDEIQATPIVAGAPLLDLEAALSSLTSPGDTGEVDSLAELVGELLRAAGPVDIDWPRRVLGLDAERARAALDVLTDAERVVIDPLTEGATTLEVCDAEILERLLRLQRAAARPALAPRPLPELPLFLACWQGLARKEAGLEGLGNALDRLLGFPAPAGLWETDILPARVDPYEPALLDALLAEGELGYIGCGDERLAFHPVDDRELLADAETASAADPQVDSFFPDSPGRFTFEDLLRATRLPSAELTRRLWGAVWAGRVSNDGFAAIRRGLLTGFEPSQAPPEPSRSRAGRFRFSRWQSTRPFAGAWRRLPPIDPPTDPLASEELRKERARLLLHRYGVVFRELVGHELSALAWGAVFRALRLMELGGEVVTGEFFSGVPGPQFALPEAVRVLREGLPEDALFWFNACDPASPCGSGLASLTEWPRRLPTNHLVFEGARLVMTSEAGGKRLRFESPPDAPRLEAQLALIKHLLTRPIQPMRGLVVETINGEPAPSSPYRTVLARLFHATGTGDGLRLGRRY